MKKKTVRALCVFCAVCAFLTLFSCKNVDPNVKSKEDSETEARVDDRGGRAAVTDAETTGEAEARATCVGGGRDQSQVVDGVTVDVRKMALRSYELCFMLAQTNFASPKDISAESAVQFAFCLLYYDELWRMPATGDVYRKATVNEIEKKLSELFWDTKFDVKTSPLYSTGLDRFEMFEPHYGQSIYYNVDSAEASEKSGKFEIFTTFFEDSAKTKVLGRTVLTVEIHDGGAYISALSSEF